MNQTDLLRHRLANQQLVEPRLSRAGELVQWLGAVQSQDYAGARWALGQRLAGATDAAIERAFDAGEFLRTHVLRPTWHFVTPGDIRWMLRLTAPRVKAAMAPYDRALGLDDAVYARSNAAIATALSGRKQLTRGELERVVGSHGIEAKGQALAHLAMRAELDGVICSGARKGKQHTYALLEERVADAQVLDGEEALAELTRRYMRSHGPATVRDFAWWSGLTLGDARRGVALLRSELQREAIGNVEYWLTPSQPPPMPAKAYLLPNYDEYTIAYKDRDVYFDAEQAAATPRRANVPFDHAVVLGGRVVGMWRRTYGKGFVGVDTHLFEDVGEDGAAAIRAAAGRYQAFLEQSVVLDAEAVMSIPPPGNR